jgi:hypothetical protein
MVTYAVNKPAVPAVDAQVPKMALARIYAKGLGLAPDLAKAKSYLKGLPREDVKRILDEAAPEPPKP